MVLAQANLARGTVAAAPNPALTGPSLTVQSGQGAAFGTGPTVLAVWPAGADQTPTNTEFVLMTARSGDTLTITRAREGSIARAIVVGDQVAQVWTAGAAAEIWSALSGKADAAALSGKADTAAVSGIDSRVAALEAGSGGTAVRVAASHPFRVASPWNLPLATTAVFESATSPATASFLSTTNITTWLNAETFSHPMNYASAGDPWATVTDTNDGSRTRSARIPATAVIAAGTDKHMHVVDPSGRWLLECWDVTRVSSTAYTAGRVALVDLHGDGLGPASGVRAYGGSAAVGSVRASEAAAGVIPHALAVAIDGAQLKSTGGTSGYNAYGEGLLTGYIWPATEQDASGGYTGACPMGAWLAIPPSVSVAALGLSGPGAQVATALQTYGACVVDRAIGAVTFYGEPTIDAAWREAVRTDLPTIRQLLRVVSNVTAATPGGGPWTGDASNRVAPLAAPLSTPPAVS